MKNIWDITRTVISIIGGWIGWFIGEFDGLLYVLISFIIIDYITGVMCAAIDKDLSSKIGYKGICRKILIFLLIGITHILDMYVLGSGSVLRTAAIFFYISNEGVSILENTSHLGLPIPEKLKDVLKQLHDKSNEDGDNK